MNTYENKHKEEIIRATQLWECGDITRENLEYIFPELKESMDEKIRKSLINLFKIENFNGYVALNGIDVDDVIAWLEKQCKKEQDVRYENLEELLAADDIYQMAMNDEMVQEAKEKAVNALSEMCIGKLLGVKKQDEQTPSDKVEPKFHKGEWIVHHGTENIYQVEAIVDNQYQLKYGDNYAIQKCADVDRCARLWTIQDAKDGDILWHSDSASNGIFIFKEIRHDGKVLCYCDYDSEDHFCTGEYHSCCWSCDKYIKPATKEQCDLLFSKMHEAGYVWNAEKKELKRLENQTLKSKWTDDDEQYLLVCKNALHKYQVSDKWDADIISKWLEDKLKQGEQKSKWSEEDDYNVHCCIAKAESDIANGCTGRNKELIEWLKQLKQRMEE